ncbi:MAG: hypothetical protein K2X82_04705 [Gemmataceae bacterium]|nr:hypothetical protein [Gemmataceae bacterium]
MTLSRAGTYRYEGQWHVLPLGDRAGPFPGRLFDRLAEVCDDLGVLALDDVYPSDFDDTPSTTVTIRHAGGVKVVRDDGGGLAPARLWGFAVVEHAMREAFELDDRRHKGRR